MNNILIVVDMQNDFVDEALGTKEAVAIVPAVKEKIEKAIADGTRVIFTRDTHHEDYMETQEGKNLPVPHCIEGTHGWEIIDELLPLAEGREIFNKPTFGSIELAQTLMADNEKEAIDSIELIGLCTDICVISNAMLVKAAMPEVAISVDSKCCAGVTPESHDNALKAFAPCQIKVI